MEKILVVDDNHTNLKILNLILSKEGYNVETLDNPLEVENVVSVSSPDLILLDINMPDVDGFEVCHRLQSDNKTKEIPIIFVSALNDSDTIVKGFSLGAVDYITKPFNADEIKARISTHLKIKSLQKELEDTNEKLEEKVAQQVKEISKTQMETIFSLAKLAQSRDDDTGKHLLRVQKYCQVLTQRLKEDSVYSVRIDDEFLENIVNASTLHDIGKVGITDLILLKPSKLTAEEYEIMKTHTIIGYETLDEVDRKFGNNSFIAMGKVVARHHHERWDGNGYPDKLSGENIPLAARIMSIADVYDALRSKRVYKEAFDKQKSDDIIKNDSGTQFDPVIVKAFLEVASEFDKISNELKD